MLFDTHAHYDDEAFDPDRREVLAGLPQKGVGLVVDPGCTLTSSEKAVALAAEFPRIFYPGMESVGYGFRVIRNKKADR